MNKLQVTINKLRNKISQFRNENDFEKINSVYVYNCNAIEIALSLSEIGILQNRTIKDTERIWFLGHRYIDDTFGSTENWSDIYFLYFDLVNLMKEEKLLT